jgi:hypothetical protein
VGTSFTHFNEIITGGVITGGVNLSGRDNYVEIILSYTAI